MALRKAFLRVIVSLFCAALAAAETIPRHAPEFAMNTADGKQILLSQYNGKTIVLAFILTTCPHCQKTVGILSKLQPEYAPRGLQVLACAIEDAAAQNLPGFIRQFNPSFPVGFALRDSVYEYLQHPSMVILHMPALVFIDRQRTIRAQYAGESPVFNEGDQEKNLRAEIDKLLKEGSVSSKSGANKARAAQVKK
jgi:peroxiredoxin